MLQFSLLLFVLGGSFIKKLNKWLDVIYYLLPKFWYCLFEISCILYTKKYSIVLNIVLYIIINFWKLCTNDFVLILVSTSNIYLNQQFLKFYLKIEMSIFGIHKEKELM